MAQDVLCTNECGSGRAGAKRTRYPSTTMGQGNSKHGESTSQLQTPSASPIANTTTYLLAVITSMHVGESVTLQYKCIQPTPDELADSIMAGLALRNNNDPLACLEYRSVPNAWGGWACRRSRSICRIHELCCVRFAPELPRSNGT